ncbi:alginate lyase family protein [Paraburkholderia sp. CNPSo 3272]|uniref:alginate lyase family protein n=1 Tax=Paraburkholderia sp. CNPSo 3272 TaxID=2940931 RepID=UPI0020B74E8E|nr:alginate lyase family protein [Paraburkholderia sp. CNPSo 3272]MCP3727455.1 alginate lyase family protein [Paraburkholderia sp. CNPSo 3272]
MSRKSTLTASIVAAASLSACVTQPANNYAGGDRQPAPVAARGPSDIEAKPFAHPGLLHSEQDFERMRVDVAYGKQPWLQGWQRLIANRHASLDWTPRPQDAIYRGKNLDHAENYPLLFNDAAAAYALALRWKVSGDDAYADKSIEILNAWSGNLKKIDGSSDKFLASGIYGYELANAAEILRSSPQWKAADFRRFQSMMLNVFYTMNHDFLTKHNGTKVDHYWANWDLANMASMLAIGVLTDRRDIYTEAVEYFKHGAGNGSIEHLVWKLYPNGLGQVQESGRDQGHTMLDFALAGAFCQMAWNQGDDLFGYDSNRLLKGAEYAAQYNLGQDVPYTLYSDSLATQPEISSGSRGDTRPIWELLYNHYVVLRKLKAPGVAAYAQRVRPEGGGGDYGSTSGGFDQLGYGTLTYTLK